MNYGKSLAQVLATVVSAVLAATVGGGSLDVAGWIGVVISALGAVSVAVVPNLTATVARYAKAAVVVLGVVLPQLALFVPGGLDTSEILQLVVAALGAVGVYAVPGPVHPTAARV